MQNVYNFMPIKIMLNTHQMMAVNLKQSLRANFEMDSHVFGDNHGSKTNDSYSECTFQPIDTAKAEYLTF